MPLIIGNSYKATLAAPFRPQPLPVPTRRGSKDGVQVVPPLSPSGPGPPDSCPPAAPGPLFPVCI